MLSNGVGLCVGCHLYKLHGNQGDIEFLNKYMAILNDLIPHQEQQNIIQVGHSITKYSVSDMEQMISEFEKILNGEAHNGK